MPLIWWYKYKFPLISLNIYQIKMLVSCFIQQHFTNCTSHTYRIFKWKMTLLRIMSYNSPKRGGQMNYTELQQVEMPVVWRKKVKNDGEGCGCCLFYNTILVHIRLEWGKPWKISDDMVKFLMEHLNKPEHEACI